MRLQTGLGQGRKGSGERDTAGRPIVRDLILGDDALLYIVYVTLICDGHPIFQLLGGAAVNPHLLTAAPPSRWDKESPDKHHRFSVECILSLI